MTSSEVCAVTTQLQKLAELRTTARELRGCGATVGEIARALKVSQAEALTLLGTEVLR